MGNKKYTKFSAALNAIATASCAAAAVINCTEHDMFSFVTFTILAGLNAYMLGANLDSLKGD